MKAFIVIVLFALVTRAFCRPNGAPTEACTQLIPQHPPSVPLAGTGPYTLDVKIPSLGYLSGHGYELTLSSNNPNVTFRGFIVQARTQPDNDIVGSFIVVDNQTTLQECQLSGEDPVSSDGTITHNSRTDKTSVSLRWVAPSNGTGSINFIYSVVANYSTYWVRIGTPLFFEDTGVEREIDGLRYFECGSRRACFQEPHNCRGSLCTYAATWRVDQLAQEIEVEMTRNNRGWIALGFSDDDQMGGDDVFVCQSSIDGSSVIVKDTYNPGGYTPNTGESNQDDITMMEWSSINTIILCRFRRTLRGNSNGNHTIDKDLSTGQYYMFFAFGNALGVNETDGVGGIHLNIPKMTEEQRSPADVSDVEVHVPSLQETAQSITVLEGQSVSFSCTPTPDDLMVDWTMNNHTIISSEHITLSPEHLHHTITIRNVATGNSGEYFCFIADLVSLSLNKTITLNVLQACPQNYTGGILWNRHRVNEISHIRCSNFYPSFRPAVYITRTCNINGEWDNVDYSSCTMRLEALPLIMVEVKDLDSSINTTSIVNQVTESVLRVNFTVSSVTYQVHEVPPSNILVVFMEVNSNSVPETIITSIRNHLGNLSAEAIITGFQPSFQCSCLDVVRRNTLNYICYGPSVAPCTFENGSYRCTEDTYTGNGTLCGLDSDSDGFPDVQLNCIDQHCEQDECPYTYSESSNSPALCSLLTDTGCHPENDTVWGIEWQFANAATTAAVKCPGLSESSGLAYRFCSQNNEWDTVINITQCQSIELLALNDVLNENLNILNNNTNNNTRDLTIVFDITEVESISRDVTDLTNVSTGIVPNDINETNRIVSSLISIIENVVEVDISTEAGDSLQSIVQSTSSTIDNLLATSNAVSFEESNNMQIPVAEDLLRNTEDLAIAIGDLLEVASGNTSNGSMTINRKNIGM